MKISINGAQTDLPADARVSLLDMLREHLHLSGTKKGCNQGACGACTVLLDGRERILSCMALAVQYEGRAITTIEGLASSGEMHPLQRAFIEHDGFQCGYCTPGQICSAVGMADELSRGVPSHVTADLSAETILLTHDELRERMSGNLCRCGAYNGGAFGCKSLWTHHILAAAASRLADRPVRIMLSREGVYRVVGGRTNTEQRVAIGAQADGRFDALIHTGVVAMSPHNNMPEPFILPARTAYAAGSFRLEVEVATLDMLANTFMRAPGESVGTFALESAVDELAAELGMDPIELRFRNEPEKDPTTGLRFSSRHVVEAYRAGAERFGWTQRNARPAMRREGEWLVGIGCATATYPYYRMPGGVARITLSKDGRAKVEIAAHEMGMGTSTAQTQVTAERLGLPMERVTFCYGDSSYPGLVLAGGSQQTASIGGAVVAAQAALVTALLKLAGKESPLSGLKPGQLRGHDSGLCKVDEPKRHESYAAILQRAGREELTVEAAAPPPFEMLHWSMHSYGAMFCEARVNVITGEPRISRFLGSFDCGRIMNAKTASSQLRGGIVMGLGLALTEETQFDERNGRIMNPSLAEYHVPVHMDVPNIDVMWTDIPDPHAPMGAHGVGEIGITGVGAAVANAIYNACGRRIRSLPITLDKLL